MATTTSTVISERTSFSRKSATYTASTFTAFESYGSTYEYHGLYNTKSEESDESEGRKISKDSVSQLKGNTVLENHPKKSHSLRYQSLTTLMNF